MKGRIGICGGGEKRKKVGNKRNGPGEKEVCNTNHFHLKKTFDLSGDRGDRSAEGVGMPRRHSSSKDIKKKRAVEHA